MYGFRVCAGLGAVENNELGHGALADDDAWWGSHAPVVWLPGDVWLPGGVFGQEMLFECSIDANGFPGPPYLSTSNLQ